MHMKIQSTDCTDETVHTISVLSASPALSKTRPSQENTRLATPPVCSICILASAFPERQG
eukprot:m.277497 g.277497  ORF g.277497 m.277497 type:complete len:60 (-) comp15728_c1_seq6:2706-2885(-)